METSESRQETGANWPLFYGGLIVGGLVATFAIFFFTETPGPHPGPMNGARDGDAASAGKLATGKPAASASFSKPQVTRDDTHDLELELELERGRELSKVICAGCHLYPEPRMLDKVNWGLEVLPDMALFMGLDDGDPYEKLGAEKRVRDAGIIPTEPVVGSIEDWRAICAYYLKAAPDVALPQIERSKIEIGLEQFETVIPPQVQSPQSTLVRINPVDRVIYVGEATTNTLAVFDANLNRKGYLDVASPPSDVEVKGDILYVLCMGDLLPSDELKGKLSYVGRPGSQFAGSGEVLTQLPRPVDFAIADLNGDGQDDIAVCGFGNLLGKLMWFENAGGGKFTEHVILERPGAIKVLPHDFNGDGKLDLIAMFAQSKEGIYIFENAGNGDFLMNTVFEKNPAWGLSYFELADMDNDGDPDLLVTNGDNGDHVKFVPPFKNYHGARVYLNDGDYNFTESWFYPINGAYKAMARDFDGDGDQDIAAIAYFADFRKSREETFIYFENQGGMKFTTRTFSETLAGRWLTMDANDLDGDGDIDIVLGAVNEGPSIVPQMLRERWKESGPPFVLLRNRLK